MTRAVAGWIAALMLMTVHGAAVAQVTAVTGASCGTTVLQNPSLLNPLRLQAGTVEFELWGTASITATNAASLFQLPGLQSVEVLALRTATQNAARGCPSIPSASLRLRSDGTITSTVSGRLTVPISKSGQSIALRVLPHPAITWVWAQTPVGGTQGSCSMPSFDYQYTSNSVLSLKIPFNAPLGIECKQKIGSRLVAGRVDAHITGPIPVRLTTQLTGLPSVDLPIPIAPESMPTQLARPGRDPVGADHAVEKRRAAAPARLPARVATPNGQTARLAVSIVAISAGLELLDHDHGLGQSAGPHRARRRDDSTKRHHRCVSDGSV